MKGFMIVVEGLDGSGKGTQSKKLLERLQNEGFKVAHFDFPNYNSKSAWLVKEYLSGNFGENFEEMDSRLPCICFAVDRLITYRDKMKELYDNGYIIICDRWVTANLLHQTSRAKDKEECDKISNWIETLEFEQFELPRPDMTFYLKVPYEYSFKTITDRYKDDGSIKNDIHEKDINFLKLSYENGTYISEKYGWNTIECFTDSMRSIEDIHEELYGKIIDQIKDLK